MLYSAWVWPRKWGSHHPQIPVKEDSRSPGGTGHPHSSALISHRLNSWWVQLREWWLPSSTHSRRRSPDRGRQNYRTPSSSCLSLLVGQKFRAGSSKLRRPEATAPPRSRGVEQECHSEKEAAVAAPSAGAGAQIMPWREKAISLESRDTKDRKQRREEETKNAAVIPNKMWGEL